MSIDIDSLINQGKEIREKLSYVDLPTDSLSTFKVYELKDSSEYHSWAYTCYRFLQNDICNEEFKSAMGQIVIKTNYLRPEFLDKMIGILESYKVSNKKTLMDEIELIERDRKLYASLSHSFYDQNQCIELYHKWYSSSLVLFKSKFDSKDVYLMKFEDVDNSHCSGYGLRSNYYEILDYYFVLLKKLKHDKVESSCMKTDVVEKKPLLFISHSSKDVNLVKQIVTLLQTIGFNKSNLFCSSVEGYGVDVGEDIYDTLRLKFEEYNIYVLFVLSENYYKSPACLNEMGATWILRSDYFTILSSGFQVPQIKGAINPNKMAIIVDNDNIRSVLDSFKSKLINIFNLSNNDDTIIWEDHRNDFIRSIKGL